jgi:murein DD-endopeptidase MepM/ murein hydrolase activator NlpD
MVLGFFLLWALAFNPGAGAKLPAAAPPRPAPLTADAAPAPAPKPMQVLRAQAGDTLMGMLQEAGVDAAPAQAAVDALKTNWDPRGLQVGQEIAVRLDDDGLKELRLSPDLHSNLILKRGEDGGFDAASVPRKLDRVPVRVAGSVSSSLSEAAHKAGVPHAVLTQLTHALGTAIDFHHEIRPGDHFVVMYRRLIDEKTGKPVGIGDVSYASLTFGDRTLQIYRFTPPDGSEHFYTAAGKSVKKALLRRPIYGARLTSPFGMRIDPVLGHRAMHTGIDLAAPVGTPVLAAGDGVVAFVGWVKGYGKRIVLSHKDGYSTAYDHLSRFAKGVRRGARVAQGKVIGYVGNTGYSTGPHLLYEIRVDDRPVNPETVKLPPAHQLKGAALAAFQHHKAMLEEQLAALRENGAGMVADN